MSKTEMSEAESKTEMSEAESKTEMSEAEAKTPTIFHPFGSIDNSTKAKKVATIRRYTKPGTVWIVQEKIHGCCVSIGRDVDGEFWCARRHAKLVPGDSFYGWEDMLPKLREHYDRAYAMLIADGIITDGDPIIIRGELCGGNYPGQKCTKKIQSGIYYSSVSCFVVFDIEIVTRGYVPVLVAMKIAKDAGFFTVPTIMTSESLDDLLQLLPEYVQNMRSVMWRTLGMPDITAETPSATEHSIKNIAEGVVIKKIVDDRHVTTVSRAILKVKITRFGERVSKPKPKSQPKPYISYIDVSEWFTDARASAVTSKLLDNDINVRSVASGLIADVTKDYIEEYPDVDRKLLLTSLQRFAFKFTADYLRHAA